MPWNGGVLIIGASTNMSLPYLGHPKAFDTMTIPELEAEYLKLQAWLNRPGYDPRGQTWYMWMGVLLCRWYELKHPMQYIEERLLSEAECLAIYEARIAKEGK